MPILTSEMSSMSPDPSNRPENRPRPGLLKPGKPEPSAAAIPGRIIPVCPRCHVALEKTAHRTGMAWRCTRCGGESLNFSQFRRMIPDRQANDIWLTAMEQPVKPQPGICCPECRQDMSAVLVPFGGREIELDLCAGCQRLWMTPQEKTSWSLDEEPAARGTRPPVISMKGRGLERNRPGSLLSGNGPQETGRDQEGRLRLWFLAVLLTVLWLLGYWLGW
jgi:Zn-finger nucleic acid-binding protein